MPQFDPALIQVMKKVLEDIMTRVPLEHSTPAAKAYFAECLLKAAAQGKTSYDALIVAAASSPGRTNHNRISYDTASDAGRRSVGGKIRHRGSDKQMFGAK